VEGFPGEMWFSGCEAGCLRREIFALLQDDLAVRQVR